MITHLFGSKFIGIAEDYKVVDILEQEEGFDIIVEKRAIERASKKSK